MKLVEKAVAHFQLEQMLRILLASVNDVANGDRFDDGVVNSRSVEPYALSSSLFHLPKP